MKNWRIPVVYQMAGVVEVEANTLAEAIRIAEDPNEEIPLPDDGEYLDGSWEVATYDMYCLRRYYNGNQEDC